MSDTTRRQFLEVAGAVTAAAVLAPDALAAERQIPAPVIPPGSSPLPIGPGAPYSAYQSEIYISGMSAGVKPPFTTNLADLEAAASNRLSVAARRHLLRWAGGAAAVRANDRALRRWRIVPRMFIDRAERDLAATVLGVEMAAPVILGPIGNQTLAHPDGEGASARAAALLGLTYVHAEQASTPIEALTLTAPLGSKWFALDWPATTTDLTRLTRARNAGCTHLVLSPPQPGGGWAALDKVRDAWGGPIVLGGVQTVADARMALRRGFDGIVVSNERGRRGADPVGTIDVLPQIADAVGDRLAVLFGAGVRTGTDIYRALALGADAVVLGRPYVQGLGCGGEAAVRHVLRTFLAELDITLGIAGVSGYRELDRSALVRA